MITATLELELESVWTDVTEDLWPVAIRWSRGIFDQGPLARIARPGPLVFALDNSDQNSAGTASYYSPGHANVRTGFRHGIGARLKLTDGTNTRYVWRGQLRVIQPDVGVTGPRLTACTAFDWMALFAETDAANLMLREAVRSDELIQDLVDLVSRAPDNTDIDVGQDEYPFAFDDLGGDPPKCTQVAQDVMQSEFGYLYVRGDATDGETLRVENRFAGALASTVAQFTEADLLNASDAVEVPSSLDHIVNDAEVLTVSRRADAAATSVLVQLDGPVHVEAGQSVELFVDYRDPDQAAAYVGGKDMVTPAATTDWTANANEDGSGADLTASVTVDAAPFGSRVMLTLSSLVDAYVRGPGSTDGLQMRGRGLYRFAPVASHAINSDSIDQFGTRQLPSPLVMPYQNSRQVGQDLSYWVANTYGGLTKAPTRIRLFTELDDLEAQGILRDLGDQIEISEAQTGVDEAAVFIRGLAQELEISTGLLKTWYTVAPAEPSKAFIFDESAFDEAALGYG